MWVLTRVKARRVWAHLFMLTGLYNVGVDESVDKARRVWAHLFVLTGLYNVGVDES